VKFHLRAAFEKLGVTSRAEALMAAIRRGELSV
jgi:DNA-binding CsgD family transcriptional regulator